MSFLVPPDDDQLQRIRDEDVYRSAAELEADVTELIEWLSQQPHLPDVTDRQWLLHFLVGCKYNLERSKQVIESYFISRAELPEFFEPYTKEQLEYATQPGKISILPKMTPDGYRVICARGRDAPKDHKFDVLHYGKIIMMLLDLQLRDEPMYGYVFLNDMSHFRVSQFMSMTPSSMKKIIRCLLNAFPLRVKAIHFVNPPNFMYSVITFFKMFMPKKLKKRFFVHNTPESLYQYIPKDMLPEIYGGTDDNIKKYEEYATEMFLSNKTWFENRPKADLSKRREKSNKLNTTEAFKNMQID